jgi:ABC-type dipeptide/oligopeptide/nickel transport system permease subunit
MASALLIAVFITFFSAWVGLLIGIILSIFVVGLDKTEK